MLLSGVYVVKDVIVSVLFRRLQPQDLVAFGQTCKAARQLARNSKAAKRAAFSVINQCSNRRDVHALHKKRLPVWNVLTKYSQGLRYEKEHFRIERLLVLKIMQILHQQPNGVEWGKCTVTKLRLLVNARVALTYLVDSAAGTVHCGFWGNACGEMLGAACTCGKERVLRCEGQLENIVRTRANLFDSSGTHIRWWKL